MHAEPASARAATPMRRRGLALLAAVLVFVLGNARAPGVAGRGFVVAGVYCDTCPDPVVNTFGVEFRNGELWTMSLDGTLTRLSGCQPVQVLSVQGFRGVASGLGWDSRRDQFIVTDAEREEIAVIDLHGNVVREFPAPGTGSIGAVYDPTRDRYWVTDFETDSLYALDPITGVRDAVYYLTRHARVAGAAYDAAQDAIVYQTRVLATMGYAVSCATGAVIDSFPLPYTGFNGWEDNAIAPDGALWAHNFEHAATYCLDHQSVPVRHMTWGALKQRYR